jgi:hypothetical protein
VVAAVGLTTTLLCSIWSWETRPSGYGVAPFVGVPGVATGCGAAVLVFVSVAGAAFAGAVVLAGAVVTGAAGVTSGNVAAASPVVEKPLRPLIPSPDGSIPSGDPPLIPSMPFIRGNSSELSGFTSSAVMMNINSVSCF